MLTNIHWSYCSALDHNKLSMLFYEYGKILPENVGKGFENGMISLFRSRRWKVLYGFGYRESKESWYWMGLSER